MISPEPKVRTVPMTESVAPRAWTLPTSQRAAKALAPLAVLVLMLAIPAVPGGVAVVSAAGAPHAAASAMAVAPPSPSAHGLSPMAPFGASGLGSLAVPVYPSVAAEAKALQRAPALSPHPAGSSAANFELTGSDCASYGGIQEAYQFPFSFAGTATASPSNNNQTIDVAAGLGTNMFDGTGGVNCTTLSYSTAFYNDGFTAVFHSTDGGHTFTQTWIPVNTSHWQKTGDPSYGSVNWGNPSIATGPNDSVWVANLYANGECQFEYFTNTSGCSNATGFENDWGVAASESGDGGTSFNASVQISAQQGIVWEDFSGCTSVSTGFYFDHIPQNPTIAVNPSNGHAIITWSVFSYSFNTAGCSIGAVAQTFESVSTDMGASWSAPKAISSQAQEFSTVAFGAGTSPQITAAFVDFGNGSTGADIAVTHSSNDGASWSTPADIGGSSVWDGTGQVQYPDSFYAASFLDLAADTSVTSPYQGHEYLVWADNQTGSSYAGDEAIRMIEGTNNGSSWGTSFSTLTTLTSGTSYIEPTVSVAPNGDVWVTYYGVNTGSGNYDLYGVLSTNGGTTWSPQFVITDTSSSPGSSVYDIGSRAGLVATSNGAYPSWTDCRGGTCASNYDVLDFAANVKPVTLSSNAGAVALSVTTAGVTNTVTTPATLGWDNVSSHTVSAPQYVPDTTNTSDVYGFVDWSGINGSLSFTTTFTYGGNGTSLVANYNPLPAATIEGTFYPATSASLKLNTQPVTLTPFNATADQYKVVVASGIAYTFTASAGAKYQSVTHTVATGNGGGIYWYNYSLNKSLGSLKGTLTPANAKLTINGTQVTNVSATTGAFNVPEQWGWYWVNASGSGLTSFSEELEVNPAQTTVVNPTLYGGWITGTVSLGGKTVPGLVVKVDDAPIPVNVPSYTFNQTVLGGFHNVTATAPGYNLSTISNLYVTPGAPTSLAIVLTNDGWISGSIAPAAALGQVQLRVTQKSGGGGNYYPVNKVTGDFNLSILGNTEYIVNVSATGYVSYQSDYNVTPGNATPVSVTLVPAKAGCTGSNCNPPPNCTATGTCPSNGSNNNGGGFPTTDLIIIVVVILLAAVVAAVLLMRGRGRGGAPAEYDEGPATYQDTGTGSMPKLQPDGSFGGPPPPPPQ